MKNPGIMFINLLFLSFGCGGNMVEPVQKTPKIELVAASGNMVDMTGIWQTCAEVNGVYLHETFNFEETNLILTINIHGTANCSGPAMDTEVLTMTFQIGETYQVELAGKNVLANKITGTAISNKTNVPDSFKQAFHVDDSSTPLRLYHGVFGDDGGQLTTDGYPLNLHQIAFTKQ